MLKLLYKLIASIIFMTCLCTIATAANYYNGKTLFDQYCAQCHGNDGKGLLAGTPNFTRGQRLMRADKDLLTTIESGKNAMPAFQGVLSREEMLDTLAYIRMFF